MSDNYYNQPQQNRGRGGSRGFSRGNAYGRPSMRDYSYGDQSYQQSKNQQFQSQYKERPSLLAGFKGGSQQTGYKSGSQQSGYKGGSQQQQQQQPYDKRQYQSSQYSDSSSYYAQKYQNYSISDGQYGLNKSSVPTQQSSYNQGSSAYGKYQPSSQRGSVRGSSYYGRGLSRGGRGSYRGSIMRNDYSTKYNYRASGENKYIPDYKQDFTQEQDISNGFELQKKDLDDNEVESQAQDEDADVDVDEEESGSEQEEIMSPIMNEGVQMSESAPGKVEIMKQIDKIDDELASYEQMLEDFNKQKISNSELSDSEIKVVQVKTATKLKKPKLIDRKIDYDLASKIYMENQSKASKAQKQYDQDQQFPLFGSSQLEPSSYPFYNKNIENFKSFKHILVNHLRKQADYVYLKEQKLFEEYNLRFDEWQELALRFEDEQIQKLSKMSNKIGRGANKKAVEDLYSLVNAYDPTATPYGPPQSDEDFRYLKSVTAPTPMLLDEVMREKVRFFDNNTYLEDQSNHIKHMIQANPWNDEEKQIFVQMFLEYPKEFGKISQFIPNKSAQDCVLYYYLNKKALKLKQLTKQALASRNRRRKKNSMEEEEMLREEFAQQQQYDRRQSTDLQSQDENLPIKSRTDSLQIDPEEDKNWSQIELEAAKKGFEMFGKDFKRVSQNIGTKTILEVRRLYLFYKKIHDIDLTLIIDDQEVIDNFSNDSLDVVEEFQKPTNEAVDKEKKKKRGRPAKNRVVDEEQELQRPASPKDKKKTISYWTSKEKIEFQNLLKKHGKNFKLIAQDLPTKSETQVRNFYHNNKDVVNFSESDGHKDDKKSSSEKAQSIPPIFAPHMFPFPYPTQMAPGGENFQYQFPPMFSGMRPPFFPPGMPYLPPLGTQPSKSDPQQTQNTGIQFPYIPEGFQQMAYQPSLQQPQSSNQSAILPGLTNIPIINDNTKSEITQKDGNKQVDNQQDFKINESEDNQTKDDQEKGSKKSTLSKLLNNSTDSL